MREEIIGAGITVANIEVVGQTAILLLVVYVFAWMLHVYRSPRGKWFGPMEFAARGLLRVSAAGRFGQIAAMQVWEMRGRYQMEFESVLRRVQG